MVHSMREYILTKLEKKMLENYLEKGYKTKDFTVLLYRVRKSVKRLQADMKLILAVLDREE